VQCVNLQWHIARNCLGNLVELNIRSAKVSILLTEKIYFYVFYRNENNICFSYRTNDMLKYMFWEDLSSFEYVEIMPMMLLQIEMCVKCDLNV
jgi:hypothetical protein